MTQREIGSKAATVVSSQETLAGSWTSFMVRSTMQRPSAIKGKQGFKFSMLERCSLTTYESLREIDIEIANTPVSVIEFHNG